MANKNKPQPKHKPVVTLGEQAEESLSAQINKEISQISLAPNDSSENEEAIRETRYRKSHSPTMLLSIGKKVKFAVQGELTLTQALWTLIAIVVLTILLVHGMSVDDVIKLFATLRG